MSRRANDWVWGLMIKSPTCKLILLTMADRADERHECFPSVKRMVRDTSLDKKTVYAGIKKLVAMGLISDTSKRRGRTKSVIVYRLNLNRNVPLDIIKSTPKNGSASNGQADPETGKLSRPKNGSSSTPENGSTKLTQKRVIEPPISNHPYNPLESATNLSNETDHKNAHAHAENNQKKPTSISQDFKPTQTTLDEIKKAGIRMNESELKKILEMFIAHYQANGKMFPDWQAGFKLWCLREYRYYGGKSGSSDLAEAMAQDVR